jgi:hypothetical protein
MTQMQLYVGIDEAVRLVHFIGVSRNELEEGFQVKGHRRDCEF